MSGAWTKDTQTIALSVNIMGLTDSKTLDLGAADLQDAVNILVAHEHALCRGDEDAADELLADLEPHLRRLGWTQNEWLRGLSGDLHMLNDEETPENNPYSDEEYWSLMAKAWVNIEEDAGEFLRLLRFRQDRFSPPGVAYARGRAYGILGFLNAATVFMRLASGLAPQQSYYKMALLTLLNRQERFDELDKELGVILTDPATDSDMVVVAVTLSFMRATRASVDLARTYLGEMRRTLQRALDEKPSQTMKPLTTFMGLHTLGSIQDRLNRPVKAQELYRQALKINPQDQTVRVSLALSLLRNNEREAFRIFSEVAAEGTRFEVAYLFAAKHAGEQGRFADAAAFAEEVITTAGNPLAVAYAHEFLAISEAELNGLTDKAREHFAEALRLAPDNANIQSNHKLFHANSATSEVQYLKGTKQKEPSSTWLLTDANLVEIYRLGLQTNQDGITKRLDEESKRLDTVTAENLTRQSKFARAA